MAIGFKSFGYVAGRSAYGELQSWRAKRSSGSSMLSSIQGAGNVMASLLTSQSDGLGQLAAKQAAARISAAGAARIQATRDSLVDTKA